MKEQPPARTRRWKVGAWLPFLLLAGVIYLFWVEPFRNPPVPQVRFEPAQETAR